MKASSLPKSNGHCRSNATNGKRPTTTAHAARSMARLDKLVTVCPHAKAVLNVTVVYEDDTTREWAKEAFDRAVNLAGQQPVRPTWWRLNNLAQPGVLAAAASTAMRADVIIIAVHAAEGLPLPFYTWINSWAPHRLQLNGVLVALLGSSRASAKRSGRVGDYLRTVSRSARLHCLVEPRSVSTSVPVNGHALNGRHPALAVRF